MKKLLILVCLGMLCISPVYGADSLSDESMQIWESVIIFCVIDDMDFLAATKPVDFEKHLSSLKFIKDTEVENQSVVDALSEIAPNQTYKQNGGDCEDLTIYTIARLLQAKSYDLGFIYLRDPNTNTQGSQHIAAVLLTEAGEIIVYDLTLPESVKRLPLALYLHFWHTTEPGFDAYRIWWFFAPDSIQPSVKRLK